MTSHPGPQAVEAGSAVALADSLHSAAIHLLRAVKTVDRASGLTPERLSLLSVIVFGGAGTVSELAEAEGVSAPAVSRMLNGLEEAGLARRARDHDDRRVVRVLPTARGRRLMDRARRRRIELLSEGLARVSHAELSVLAKATGVLSALVADLNASQSGRRSDG